MTCTDRTLERARAGDEQAFRELTDPYRRELQVHCYRILGSVQDAEDVLQETLLAAWRGLDGFEERASVRTWLYRIATNRCLNALRDSGRRRAAADRGRAPVRAARADPPGRAALAGALPRTSCSTGLPDTAPGPEARYEAKESIALAFVAAASSSCRPGSGRCCVLRDVLGFRAAEVAGMLDSTEASVNSALQRARATLDARLPGPSRARAAAALGPRARAGRAVRGGVRGRRRRRRGRAADRRRVADDAAGAAGVPGPRGDRRLPRDAPAGGPGGRLRLVPTRRQRPAGLRLLPAATPQRRIAHADGVIVLTLEGDRITAITRFGDTGVCPLRAPAHAAAVADRRPVPGPARGPRGRAAFRGGRGVLPRSSSRAAPSSSARSATYTCPALSARARASAAARPGAWLAGRCSTLANRRAG